MVILYKLNPRTDAFEECERPNAYKLAHLGMLNGMTYNLTVHFERSLAILSKHKRSRIIRDIEENLVHNYPKELIEQSMNMAQ